MATEKKSLDLLLLPPKYTFECVGTESKTHLGKGIILIFGEPPSSPPQI